MQSLGVLATPSIAMWNLVLSNGLNIILDPIYFGWDQNSADMGFWVPPLRQTLAGVLLFYFQLAILFFGWQQD